LGFSVNILFPKPEHVLIDEQFNFITLSRDTYANAAKINAVIRNAFAVVQLPEYTAYSFRIPACLHTKTRGIDQGAEKDVKPVCTGRGLWVVFKIFKPNQG